MRGKRGSDRDGLLHGLAAEAWSELSRAVVIERLCDRLLDSEAGAEVGELLRAIRGLARRLEDWRLELWLQLVLLTDRPVRKREQLDLAGFLRGLAPELAAEYPDVTFDLPQELPVVGEGRLLMFLFILLFQVAVELGGEGAQLSLFDRREIEERLRRIRRDIRLLDEQVEKRKEELERERSITVIGLEPVGALLIVPEDLVKGGVHDRSGDAGDCRPTVC